MATRYVPNLGTLKCVVTATVCISPRTMLSLSSLPCRIGRCCLYRLSTDMASFQAEPNPSFAVSNQDSGFSSPIHVSPVLSLTAGLINRGVFSSACYQVVPWETFVCSGQNHESLISSGKPVARKETPLFDQGGVVYLRDDNDDRRCQTFLRSLVCAHSLTRLIASANLLEQGSDIFPILERQGLAELQICFLDIKELDPSHLVESYRLRFRYQQGHGFTILVHWGGSVKIPEEALPSRQEEDGEFYKLKQFISTRPPFDEGNES